MPSSSGVTLSFGYDTERPYGAWARGPRGDALRASQLETVRRINACFDALDAPRTFFLLGDYLEQCAQRVPLAELRAIYDRDDPRIDLQQHSYSHSSLRPIPGRPDEPLASAAEFGADVQRASRVIEELLGARPTGLRIPRGYDQDLTSLPEVVDALVASGIEFVSSNLRSPSLDGRENFLGALSAERQPRRYHHLGASGLVELPSHGLQDAVFTAEIAERSLGRAPAERGEIARHYLALFEAARALVRAGGTGHIALCLHPWAVTEYDPDLSIHREILERARDEEIEILSYAELARRIPPASPS